jgi:nucleoside-diphosphate-sugar epimerase
MAHYLVSGTAGFIANRVAELLLQAGHYVTGIDNLNDAYDVRIKEYRLQKLKSYANFTFKRMDIADKEAVFTLEGTAASRTAYAGVINLAARAGVRPSVENPWIYYDTNVTGTLNLLELCRRSGIPKFILASTSSIYGLNAPLPTPETSDSDHPLQPYAASKKAAEVLCYTYHALYQVDVTVFRFFTVYGPAGRPDMSMFRFVQWISEGKPVRLYGDGEQSRGFTYVDDISRGTILGLKPLGYEVINLGGHESIKIKALIQMIEDRVGKKALIAQYPANPAEMLANLADVRKAGSLLGWKPAFSLDEGVSNLAAWYNAERAWAKEIATG